MGQFSREGAAPHPEDLKLVRGALARDPEALRSFARRTACVPGFLRGRAARTGIRMHSTTLDDLTQETYLALWGKLGTYRGLARLETWVCGFACIQLRRWQASRSRDRLADGEFAEEPRIEAQLPDDTVEFVEAVLGDLGPPVEDVVRLKHFEGLTFDGIAKRLEMSANTAKSHYYRGLARLRERLGSRGEELVN